MTVPSPLSVARVAHDPPCVVIFILSAIIVPPFVASRPLHELFPVVVIVESLISILELLPVQKTAFERSAEVLIVAFVTVAVESPFTSRPAFTPWKSQLSVSDPSPLFLSIVAPSDVSVPPFVTSTAFTSSSVDSYVSFKVSSLPSTVVAPVASTFPLLSDPPGCPPLIPLPRTLTDDTFPSSSITTLTKSPSLMSDSLIVSPFESLPGISGGWFPSELLFESLLEPLFDSPFESLPGISGG